MRGAPLEIENSYRRHLENPFLVLGLPTRASFVQVERQGQKLLAMLAAGLEEARQYATPFGAAVRTDELVRWAVAELRDPARRLGHEWWAEGWKSGVEKA
jgi:hypothetical protein